MARSLRTPRRQRNTVRLKRCAWTPRRDRPGFRRRIVERRTLQRGIRFTCARDNAAVARRQLRDRCARWHSAGRRRTRRRRRGGRRWSGGSDARGRRGCRLRRQSSGGRSGRVWLLCRRRRLGRALGLSRARSAWSGSCSAPWSTIYGRGRRRRASLRPCILWRWLLRRAGLRPRRYGV